jgi:hypothetical protein
VLARGADIYSKRASFHHDLSKRTVFGHRVIHWTKYSRGSTSSLGSHSPLRYTIIGQTYALLRSQSTLRRHLDHDVCRLSAASGTRERAGALWIRVSRMVAACHPNVVTVYLTTETHSDMTNYICLSSIDSRKQASVRALFRNVPGWLVPDILT